MSSEQLFSEAVSTTSTGVTDLLTESVISLASGLMRTSEENFQIDINNSTLGLASDIVRKTKMSDIKNMLWNLRLMSLICNFWTIALIAVVIYELSYQIFTAKK